MEPWVWLVASLTVSVAGGAVKLLGFIVECRLRRDVEQMSMTLLEQAQLTGDARDVSAVGTSLARTITARGPLPAFRLHPAVVVRAAKGLMNAARRPASVPTPDEGGTATR